MKILSSVFEIKQGKLDNFFNWANGSLVLTHDPLTHAKTVTYLTHDP